ncbi:hypothetical protein NQZ79_g1848 [Umbelopsis isabellina]|nr:hypothetical protein NQZ79_g1848 [Umbelopsis isabellina]
MIGQTSRQFANKRKPRLEESHDKTSTRRSEPNRHAQYAKILEKQYRCLSNTTSNLEAELQQLNQVLEQGNDKLENERWEALAELDKVKQIMSHLSSENHLKMSEKQDFSSRSIAKCNDEIGRLLYNNQQVSNSIQGCLIRLAEGRSDESENRRGTELVELQERMIQSYKTQLTSEVELEAQNDVIKALEKDLQKVNRLPQILPILRYSIKDCEKAVKKHRATFSHLEDTRLLSILKVYTNQQLSTSASEKEMEKTVHNESKNDTYDEVIDILLEQAAIEQLFLYTLELEEEQLKLVADHQKALLLDNKVVVEAADAPKPQCQQGREYTKETEQVFLDSLEKILNLKHNNDVDILENLEGGSCNLSIAIANRLEKLQLDDTAARKRTEASITAMNQLMVDSFIAVEKAEPYASSYYKYQNSNGHIPVGIIQTQAQLETLVVDLQSEIQHYQKIIAVNSELAEKKRRFALFWTDQQLFEQEFGQMRSAQS